MNLLKKQVPFENSAHEGIEGGFLKSIKSTFSNLTFSERVVKKNVLFELV